MEANEFTSWVDPLVRLVTAGGFGALVWYLIVKYIPAIEDRYQKMRKTDQEMFLKSMADRDEKLDEIVEKYYMATTEYTRQIERLATMLNDREK